MPQSYPQAGAEALPWHVVSPSPAAIDRPQSTTRTLYWLGALLCWCILLALAFASSNDFPATWHPDEASKVAQLSGAPANFRHPRLLLEAARIVAAATPGETGPDDIVTAGRWVSAVAAAGTVGLLALLAAMLGGLPAGIMTALFAGTSPLLFGLAHYMKEDAAHMFAVAASLLALAWYMRQPTRARLTALAAAAGLALCAKYIGVIMPLLVLSLLAWQHRGDRRELLARCALASGVVAACFATINAAMFADPRGFLHGLYAEVAHVATNHDGFVRAPTDDFYLEGLLLLCGPVLLAAFAWWVIRLFSADRRPDLVPAVLAGFPVVYLAMLQTSPVKVMRYELPVVMVVTLLGACGLAALLRRPGQARTLAIVGVALALAFNLHALAQSYRAITHDTRGQMADWIRANVPANAVIAENYLAGLGADANAGAAPLVSAKVVELGAAVDDGTLAAARAAGITHVLLADHDFGRYFNVDMSDDPRDAVRVARHEQRRAFYRELFASGRLVHQIEAATPVGTFFSPGLWLFAITAGPADEHASGGLAALSFDLLQD